MNLEDPLEPYRVGPIEGKADLEAALAKDGRLASHVWTKGGAPAALTPQAFYFTDEGVLYKVRRKDVRGMGLARAANIRTMRYGLLFYFLGLPLLLIDPILAVVSVLLGGFLTVRGFLTQAILVRVKDDRLPPFVIRHGKWRRIRSALKRWEEGPKRAKGD